jgi:DNA-binding PadR family transcriptional regulator
LLALSPGELHDEKIGQTVLRNSNSQLQMSPGRLSGTINRMLADGLVEESGERPNPSLEDGRRRYYRLTGLEEKAVRAEAARLDGLVCRAKELRLVTPSEGDGT